MFITSLVSSYSPTPPEKGCTSNGCIFLVPTTSTYAFHLWGNEQQRGNAHGFLLCTQIIDFLEFYIIQTLFNSNITQYNNFYNFVNKNISFPNEFEIEINSIISGMQQSKKSLIIPSLNREITSIDIKLINSYLEVTATVPGPYLLANRSLTACTQILVSNQFSFNNHLLTGRNMDGECDKNKVTVTHLIIFAIESINNPKIISFMWPGFVGGLSSINEYGTYVIMNTGNMGPFQPISNITPVSIQAISITKNFVKTNFSSNNILNYLNTNFNGISGGGAILMIGNDIENNNNNIFTAEIDRNGTIIRYVGDSIDLNINNVIIASNHFRKKGVDNDDILNIYGLDVRTNYYNSSWRYEVGRQKVYAFDRVYGEIDIDAVKDFLRSVSHGETEHSIITVHNGNDIDILFAVASVDNDMWDAPYLEWYNFKFHSLFNGKHNKQ